nr:YjjG family noncanonical pyrimidine nucleotidase [Bacteriovorax sp. HI3]
MKYNLFLFDLDDTLLDFQASEKLCFTQTFIHFGVKDLLEEIHKTYKTENNLLWKQLERGEVDKDFLKVERFKRTLDTHKIEIPPHKMSEFYLEQLPKHVVLIDGAVELLKHVKEFGEIGIITNGIEYTQRERIKNSELKDYIDFIAVSEECGFAKPDVRFFEFAASRSKNFVKESTIIIGDRFDADIVGAHNFGIDSLWFNQHKTANTSNLKPTFEAHSLAQVKEILS